MSRTAAFISPEDVLRAIYGKSTLELGMSEKRRDELIAAAIFTSFRNQEFGTRFKLPANYREANETEDARGIDVTVSEPAGRSKQLQIKGVYIQRSIERRRLHQTKGAPRILGRRSWRQIQKDSEELTTIMRGELSKIIQDYSGVILIIHVIADFATQTSLEIAIKASRDIMEELKAKEVWFLRHIPVRVIGYTPTASECHAYKLIKVFPGRHTYAFSFALRSGNGA